MSFGFGFHAAPPPIVYEAPPVYVEPPPIVHEHVYVEPGAQQVAPPPVYDDRPYTSPDESDIDVENLPPAGCYYYDTYCRETFANLDEYTEHLDSHHHSQTISILREDSKEQVRVLEFVDGYWQAQQ